MRQGYESKSADQALAHAVEEAGEFCAAGGKTLRFGWDSVNPELPTHKQVLNRAWVLAELRDLRRAIDTLERFIVDGRAGETEKADQPSQPEAESEAT